MLKYLENTTTTNVTNQDISTIHQLVEKVKRRKEVSINYMKSWEIDEMNREEGRMEGREETLFAFVSTLQELQIPAATPCRS